MNSVVVANTLEAMVPAVDGTGAKVLGQELTVNGTVVGVATLPATVSHALVSVKTNDVLMRFDGVDPVAGGAGTILAKGSLTPFRRAAVNAMRFVEAVGSAAGAVHVAPVNYAG